MIRRKGMGRPLDLFVILLSLGCAIATYNFITMVLHHRAWGSGHQDSSVWPVDAMVLMPEHLRNSRGVKRPFHVAVTAMSKPYDKWQCRVMYYWYKKMREMEGLEMGGFTRVLHTGKPDNLMDEMPTFVVDALPDGMDRDYIVLNRLWAFVQWLEKAKIEEDYILMAEPDHVFVNPLPNMAHDNYQAAF